MMISKIGFRVGSLVEEHADCVILLYLLIEKDFHQAVHTQRLLNPASESHLCLNLDRLEKLNILRIEEHVSHSTSSSINLVRIPTNNDPF
jgi:hypothetical protein